MPASEVWTKGRKKKRRYFELKSNNIHNCLFACLFFWLEDSEEERLHSFSPVSKNSLVLISAGALSSGSMQICAWKLKSSSSGWVWNLLSCVNVRSNCSFSETSITFSTSWALFLSHPSQFLKWSNGCIPSASACLLLDTCPPAPWDFRTGVAMRHGRFCQSHRTFYSLTTSGTQADLWNLSKS